MSTAEIIAGIVAFAFIFGGLAGAAWIALRSSR
jgi:hypothetical protein